MANVGYDHTPFLPDSEWRVHDGQRPQPIVITPGATSADAPGIARRIKVREGWQTAVESALGPWLQGFAVARLPTVEGEWPGERLTLVETEADAEPADGPEAPAAGPAGLACAIEAKRRNHKFWVIEKGHLVNSIYNFPINMTFFTTSELLEIGDIPLTSPSEKPKRVEVLKYYRRVADDYDLPIKYQERVISVTGKENDFRVESMDRLDHPQEYRAKRVIIATGYYDNPILINIPGEDLAKVSHYYSECHPYFQKKVAVIGGSNSAAETALDLYRNGKVEVTLIHRGEAMGKKVKYWVLPDINNRIKRGEIKAYFSSSVQEIRKTEIVVSTPDGVKTLENDFVLAMTGYMPNYKLFESQVSFHFLRLLPNLVNYNLKVNHL